MKHYSKLPLILAVSTLLTGLAGISKVSAGPSLEIRIGEQAPPPRHRDERWQSPHRTAVWIAGHNEWQHRRYVWVGGYYSYPPQSGQRWEEPRYIRRQDSYYYRPGRWSN
jgi:hypothetical protein